MQGTNSIPSLTSVQQFNSLGGMGPGGNAQHANGTSSLQRSPIMQTQQVLAPGAPLFTMGSSANEIGACMSEQALPSASKRPQEQFKTPTEHPYANRNKEQESQVNLQLQTMGHQSNVSEHTAYLPSSGHFYRRQPDWDQSKSAIEDASDNSIQQYNNHFKDTSLTNLSANQRKTSRSNSANKTPSAKVGGSKVFTELFVWGNDEFGQLGLGHRYLQRGAATGKGLDGAQQIPGSSHKQCILEVPKSCSFAIQIRDVACGEDFAFLLTKKGLLYAMGSNQFGKLGIFSPENLQAGQPGYLGNSVVNRDHPGRGSSEKVPFASTPKLVESLAKHVIKKVSCGLNHAVAIVKDSGLCYSWGCGSHGQLGRPSNGQLNLNPPQVVSYFSSRSLKIVDVAAGGKHTLFLTDRDQLLAAGMNEFGQLGQTDMAQRLAKNVEPLEINGLRGKATQICCGLVHSQVLLDSGKVVTFGDNQFGQLGLGAEACITSTGNPIEVPSLSGIKFISCNHHSAAVGPRGELYFWGTGVFGTFFEPRVVVDSDIVEVSVGGSFGIAKDKDGLLWTWGQNTNGELGLSDQKTRLYPHPILTLKRKQVTKAVCGGSFAVAIGPDRNPDKAAASPHKRKKSPFHNDSTLLKILQEKHQVFPADAKPAASLSHKPIDAVATVQLENVHMFSAREHILNTVGSNSRSFVDDQQHLANFEQFQVRSNLDTEANGSPLKTSHFGNIHNQSQIFVKQNKEGKEHDLSRKKSSSSKQASKQGLRSNSKNAIATQARRSASPILPSQNSVYNLSTSPSFLSLSKKHQDTATAAKGNGAVQAPRRKKSASRSKSRPSKAPSGKFNSLRKSQHNLTQPIKLSASSSSITKAKEATRNTFQMAARQNNNDSFAAATTSQGPIYNLDINTTIAATIEERDRRVAALEDQLTRLENENRRLQTTLGKQQEHIQQMRQKFAKGDQAQVVGQLTDEMQKAHDLEYLLRGKERTIEILRGDLQEARAQKQDTEQLCQQVSAQNMSLLKENQTLQDDNFKMREALEHALNNIDNLKSQNHQFSERYGYLSHEMVTLRELANELRSSNPNTQKHTVKKLSILSAKNVIPPSAFQEGRPLEETQQISVTQIEPVYADARNRNHATMCVVSGDSAQRIDTMIEEKYLQKAPETTKNQGPTFHQLPMIDSKSVSDSQHQGRPTEPDQEIAENYGNIVFQGCTIESRRDSNQDHVLNFQSAPQMAPPQDHQQTLKLQEQVSVQDLMVREGSDEDKTFRWAQQETQASPQLELCQEQDETVTQVSATHRDNKEHKPKKLKTKSVSRSRKSTSISRPKKRSQSKENAIPVAYCSRMSQNKSTDSAQAQKPWLYNVARRRSQSKDGEQKRSISTGKTRPVTKQESVSEEPLVIEPQKFPSAFNSFNQNQMHVDSSAQQINLTVESINKLAEIISQEHQQMQASVNLGYDPTQSGVHYTVNHNQGDHSVLLKSPPNQARYDQRQLLMQSSKSPKQEHAESSYKDNSPLLTMSGQDIQGHQVAPPQVEGTGQQSQNTHDQHNQNYLSVESLDGRRNLVNGQQVKVQEQNLLESQFSQQPSQIFPQHGEVSVIQASLDSSKGHASMTNPFKHVTKVSQSVANMKREGLSLNRRPDLAAALRQSSEKNTLRCGSMGPATIGDTPSKASPVDHRLRQSHLVNPRSASLQGGVRSERAVSVGRKKETIDNFKNKLNRLEKNKRDLENKMKLFDAKVKAHTKTQTLTSELETI